MTLADEKVAIWFALGLPVVVTVPVPAVEPLISTTPVPLLTKFRFMLESEPVALTATVAGLAVAAFVSVMLSTALVVADEETNGLPFAS
jgi:hypothetical protein